MNDEHKAAAERDKTAKHLAGRAIMAMRAGFPIVSLTVHTGSAAESGIVCDWKQCRAEYSDDVTLIRRAFAFVYIGTILDQADESGIPEELLSEIKADQSQSQDIRETAAQRGDCRFRHGYEPIRSRGIQSVLSVSFPGGRS